MPNPGGKLYPTGKQAPVVGTPQELALDSAGNVLVNVAVGGGGTGGGSNAAAGPTGAAVPVDASYTGFSNAGGTLLGASAANPFPVYDYSPDGGTGATGAPVPASAVLNGFSNAGGTLVAVSATNPFPTSISGTPTVTISGNTSGTGPTGAAVPATADYLAYSNAGGTLTGVSAANPLPVTGGGNAAASATGTAVPAAGDYIAYSGAGGTLTGVSQAFPLPINDTTLQSILVANQVPIYNPDLVSTGAITTQNLNATGVGTTGSYVGFTGLNNRGGCIIQIIGTYTGALTWQGSMDGTNWYTITSGLEVLSSGAVQNPLNSAVQGIFYGSMAGWQDVRLVSLSVATGTANITIQSGQQTVGGSVNGQPIRGATGAIIDAVGTGASSPANAVSISGAYTTTALALLNSQSAALRVTTTGQLSTDAESLKASFSISGTITLAPTPTDIAIVPGSATKTVRMKRVRLSTSATTAATMVMNLIKRSTANAGGTSTAATVVPRDSTFAAGTAVPLIYTANPTTLGTSLGAIDTEILGFAVAAAGGSPTYDHVFGIENCSSIVLRGVAQGLAINLNGGAVPTGAQIAFAIDYTEE